jgi:hypothetical protein
MTDESQPGADDWRDEETASVVDDLSESGRATLDAIMAEEWAILRVARLLRLIGGLEQRMETLEAEVRSLQGEPE